MHTSLVLAKAEHPGCAAKTERHCRKQRQGDVRENGDAPKRCNVERPPGQALSRLSDAGQARDVVGTGTGHFVGDQPAESMNIRFLRETRVFIFFSGSIPDLVVSKVNHVERWCHPPHSSSAPSARCNAISTRLGAFSFYWTMTRSVTRSNPKWWTSRHCLTPESGSVFFVTGMLHVTVVDHRRFCDVVNTGAIQGGG
jgi:hypothetical protein